MGHKTVTLTATLRAVLSPLIAIMVLMAAVSPAEASWLIDARKFHISAHGQTGCQDCHDDISQRRPHPNPDRVNAQRAHFFRKKICLSCHDDIIENLKNGTHGTKKIANQEKYTFCIRCHRPHRQARLGPNRLGKFDPNRPRHEQCGACHQKRSALPPFSETDTKCLTCHRLPDTPDPAQKERIKRLCFHCHARGDSKAQSTTAGRVSLLDPVAYGTTPHAAMACTDCHPRAAQYRHARQNPGDCGQCHLPHHEKVAHDAHTHVTCGACHLKGVRPIRNPETQMVRWERLRPGTTQAISQIHEMGRLKTPDSCRRCHFKGNRVGAAAMILPAKGILCMPCHAATFSIGDTTTLLSLAVFLIGLVLSAAYWLSGSPGGREGRSPFGQWVGAAWDGVRTVFSRKIFWIGKALFLDVLLQRRLYGQSKGRWFVHSLIFVPFVFRFSWGMLALLGSLWIPEESWVWAMLDKNHPAAAFLFDLTGIMVIFGVGLALARGALHATGLRPGLPRQDRLALGLIAAVVGVGFILEGMRIAMTGQPEGSGYAVVGYIISMLLPASSWLTQIYGYIWYVHAVLTGVFVAYLPFSRLFHIMVSPVAIAINAVEEQEQKRQ